MHLIIGGAYAGKLEFAKKAYSLSSGQICDCAWEEIDFSRPCIRHLEEYVYHCISAGKDPVARFEASKTLWQNSILICRDISGGVVPMDTLSRKWRVETGRLCQYLSANADKVSRIFCGLEQKLK